LGNRTADPPVTAQCEPGRLTSRMHHLAGTRCQRQNRLVTRDGAQHLVEIPRSLGFRWGLHLHQIHVMDHTTIGTNAALLEDRIMHRKGAYRLTAVASVVPASRTAFR
jgi:hypothetical protein